MVRNIWIAVCATLWSGSLALAQLPGPANPGAYGYPGYPTPPYGPPLPMGPNAPPPPMQPYGYPRPMMPMGPGGMMPYGAPMPQPMGPGGMMPYGNPGPMGPGVMMPNMPYGNPGPMGPGAMMPNGPYSNPLPAPIPPDPRRPVGLPSYDGAGPKQGASEPYMVGSGRNQGAVQAPNGPAPTSPATPAYTPTPMMPDPYVEPASYGPPAPPAEPYTLYEGPRYQADVKQDNVCVFGQVNYIHWWTRRDRTPPLVTTGTTNFGVLGSPDTVVLLGGGAIAPHEFSGAQANFGMWLDPERLTSLEFGGFYLGKNSRQYAFASDANGNNVIAQPVQAVFPPATTFREGAFLVAGPGIVAGSTAFSSVMNMNGAEINFGRNLLRLNGLTLDWLAGFRYMYLNDTLTSTQNFTTLVGGPTPFLGVVQPTGANFVLNDSFNLTNRFYGGQIGARVDWVSCYKIDVGATVKVAFGDTAHTAIIDGTTTLNNAGASATAPGGAYSQPSNIGRFNTNDFTVVSELTFTIGYQVHPNIRLTAGYNLIYWPRVERAGSQIERTIDPGQSPTDPAFVAGTVGTFPRFLNYHSDFWAQGINVGVELKY